MYKSTFKPEKKTIAGGRVMGVHAFPKSTCSKVNGWMEFELTYYDVEVLLISHNATGTSPDNTVISKSNNF